MLIEKQIFEFKKLLPRAAYRTVLTTHDDRTSIRINGLCKWHTKSYCSSNSMHVCVMCMRERTRDDIYFIFIFTIHAEISLQRYHNFVRVSHPISTNQNESETFAYMHVARTQAATLKWKKPTTAYPKMKEVTSFSPQYSLPNICIDYARSHPRNVNHKLQINLFELPLDVKSQFPNCLSLECFIPLCHAWRREKVLRLAFNL